MNEQLKNTRIRAILDVLREMHAATKNGYAQFGITKAMKNGEHTNQVRLNFTAALLKLGIVKRSGAAKFTLWHWCGDAPSVESAEKILDTCYSIAATRQTKLKSSLVPVIGRKSNAATRHEIETLLQKLYANTAEGSAYPFENQMFPNSAMTNLVELGVLKKMAGGTLVTWVGNPPDDALVDIILSEWEQTKDLGNPMPPKRKRSRSASQVVLERIRALCVAVKQGTTEKKLSRLNKSGKYRVPQYNLAGMMSYCKVTPAGLVWTGPEITDELVSSIAERREFGLRALNASAATHPVSRPDQPAQQSDTEDVLAVIESKLFKTSGMDRIVPSYRILRGTIASMRATVEQLESLANKMETEISATGALGAGYLQILNSDS